MGTGRSGRSRTELNFPAERGRYAAFKVNPGDVEPVPDSKRVCNEYREPFEGTVRTPRPTAETPTALSGQEPRKSRLVAPFYDIFICSKYSLVVGTVTQYTPRPLKP